MQNHLIQDPPKPFLDQKPVLKEGPLSFGAPDKVSKNFYVSKITIELIGSRKKCEDQEWFTSPIDA
jgi:hypothetical protein